MARPRGGRGWECLTERGSVAVDERVLLQGALAAQVVGTMGVGLRTRDLRILRLLRMMRLESLGSADEGHGCWWGGADARPG